MATAAYTTVVDRVTQQLTNAIWDDQLQDNINMLIGKASGNLLVNGGFEIWQRGTGSFTSTGVYCADRWILDGTVMTVTKETTTMDNSNAAAKVVVAAYGGGTVGLLQKLEENIQFRGKTVSASIRINQSVASQVALKIQETGVGSTTSSTSVTTGSFVTLTVTRTLSSSFTDLSIEVVFTGNGTYYLDNCMLVIGPNAAPYEPLHPQEELARCQRYYTVWPGTAQPTFINGYGAAGAAGGVLWFFPVTMYAAPTVTKNGTWAVTNCGQPAAGTASNTSVGIFATITALGTYNFGPNSADDTFTAEANP